MSAAGGAVRSLARTVLACTLFAALSLGGCRLAPVRTEGVGPPPVERQDVLAALAEWRAVGRVAVRTPQDGWSANFDWRESAGRGELAVRGPFGAGAARIERTDRLIRLETARESLEFAAPFTELEPALVERLGAPLPVDQLRYWLLGVPAPTAPWEPTRDGFVQDGWTVAVAEQLPVAGAPAPLPRRLALTRETTRIRVVVDRWELAGPP